MAPCRNQASFLPGTTVGVVGAGNSTAKRSQTLEPDKHCPRTNPHSSWHCLAIRVLRIMGSIDSPFPGHGTTTDSGKRDHFPRNRFGVGWLQRYRFGKGDLHLFGWVNTVSISGIAVEFYLAGASHLL